MNQVYQAKVKELLIEFTRYLMEHPEWGAQIPTDAQIVLLDSHDPVYSQAAIQNAQQAQQTDDAAERPIVYIEVQELAPIQSRVRKLEIHVQPPLFAGA
ncbi:MAG: DUF5647 family protein [Caldilineaceae bacterium]